MLYIETYQLWAVAYIHMEADQNADIDGRGRIDLFDSNFELLHRHFGTVGTYRPHLLFIDPYPTWDTTMNMSRKLEIVAQ